MADSHATNSLWLGLGWVDWSLLVVLMLSVLIGLWRGLVFELLSLAAWVLAWIAATWWGPAVSAWLPVPESAGVLRLAAGYVACFVAVLLLGAVLARLVRLLVSATPLRWIDRLLGGAFGAARGLLLLLAVATLVAWTPLGTSPSWTGSFAAQAMQQVTSAWQALRPAAAA